MPILIADSGSTKCEWRLAGPRKKTSFFTQGLSPYFLSAQQMEEIIREELLPQMKDPHPAFIYFYGTGNKDPKNAKKTKSVLQSVFSTADVQVNHDLTGAARALCQQEKGIACILGTGSNSCYYNGKKISKNSPGIGYILGDEGSGAYLGKKTIRHYLYDIFEKDLKEKFDKKYALTAVEILDSVYKGALPNRYLAAFTMFLSENRGNYMIENIIEDGLNDFFANHLGRYNESYTYPVHFTGSVAYHFHDVVESLCERYGMQAGTIVQSPMEGLLKYHRNTQ